MRDKAWVQQVREDRGEGSTGSFYRLPPGLLGEEGSCAEAGRVGAGKVCHTTMGGKGEL